LNAWSVGDTYRNEPGGTAYGLRRVLSGAGVLGLLGVVLATSGSTLTTVQQRVPPPSAATVMWGAPVPTIIDRMITPLAGAPAGFVEVPVLDYQGFDEAGAPDYLDALKNFELLGSTDIPGYVGSLPDVGNGAMDFADLVIHVRGPILCVPRGVVIIESEKAIQVAVFYGRPDAADATVPDNAKACLLNEPVTSSVLIPLRLRDPLGERTVQTLAGAAIPAVEVVG
jgi:hypothetical protein